MKAICDEENICVFVANLPSFLTNSELSERLKEILGQFGMVSSVKTSRDSKNRPFAFVQFEGQVYDFLLTEMVMLENRILRFEKAKNSFIPEKPFESGLYKVGVGASEDFAHPGGMYYPCVQAEYVISYYPEYDSINSVYQIPTRPYTDLPGASYPMNYLPGEEGSNKVFVSCLNGELVTQRKLLRHFQHYGHITDIELFKNNLDGSLRPEAFAFISYLKPEQMLEAIRSENANEWLGKRLKCCRALKKRDKNSSAIESEVEANLESDGIGTKKATISGED